MQPNEPAQPNPPAPEPLPGPQADAPPPQPPQPAAAQPAQINPQSIYPQAPVNPAAQPYPQVQTVQDDEQKDFVMAFLLSWLLGGLGADRFYLGYVKTGILKLVTLGGLGIWAVIDTVRLAFGKLHDKEGLPLKGYEKNRKWVRVLAIIHILLVGLIILGIIASLVLSTKTGVQQKARDTERRVDINALQNALEGYKAKTGEYPTFTQMNSSSFRQTNFSSLAADSYKDPRGTNDQLSTSPLSNQYSYSPTPTDCTDQGTDKCVAYSLNALLESGGYYTKYSLN
jgi:type II secretory pathway pseudopilin PulG